MLLHVLLGFSVLCLASLIHEAGHLLAARLLGIPVLMFKLGVGPVVMRMRIGGTEYCLGLFPIAGFIMTPGGDSDDALDESGETDEFFARNPDLVSVAENPAYRSENMPAGMDILIYAAGPLANIATAAALFFGAQYISTRGSKVYSDVADKICDKSTYDNPPEAKAPAGKKATGKVLGFEYQEYFCALLFFASCLLGFSQLIPLRGSDGSGVILGFLVLPIPPPRRPEVRKRLESYLNTTVGLLFAFGVGIALGLLFIP